jgi:DNA-directed RNA polymerase alpha subunit
MSHNEINTIKNLGKKSLEEILEKLDELGIKHGENN